MDSTLTTKGQVTIPKAMRDHLGLQPGDRVRFDYAADGSVTISPDQPRKPIKRGRSPFAALRGTHRTGKRTDELLALLRGYADDASDPGLK